MAEMMLALSIFAVVVGSFVGLVFQSQDATRSVGNNFVASRIAAEGVSAARVVSNQDWESLTTGTYGLDMQNSNWVLVPGSTLHGKFTRTITTRLLSASHKEVESTVTWTGDTSASRSVTHKTNITNWRARQIENDISGDWRHPVSVGSGDISPNGNAGQNLTLFDHYIYLVSQHSATNSDDFHIFDIDIKPNPSRVSSLNLGNTNLVSVSASSTVAYAINRSNSNQIYVINAVNPAAPTNVKTVMCLAGANSKSSTVLNDYLVVGLEKISSGPELCVFSLADPLDPVKIGELEIGADINWEADFGSIVYLATSSDSAEMVFVDLTNPSSPQVLSAYDAPGTADGLSLFVKSESVAYLGRSSSTSDDFAIVNTASYTNPTLFYSYKTGASILSFIVLNHLAFLGTDDSNNELKILDVAWGTPPVRYDTSPLNFPQNITGFTFKNNTVYFSVKSNDALRVVGPS